jgi:hypothetical protein
MIQKELLPYPQTPIWNSLIWGIPIMALISFLILSAGCRSEPSSPIRNVDDPMTANQSTAIQTRENSPASHEESSISPLAQPSTEMEEGVVNSELAQQELRNDKPHSAIESAASDSPDDSNRLEDEIRESHFDISEDQTIEIPETWKQLGKHEIWVDVKNKQVILGGYICVNAGALEMFACPAGTKEHESVIGVNALANEMHAGLLAVGATPGSPCSWDETSFTPASGSKIEIDVRWRDEQSGEIITRSAKEMMKTHDGEMPEIEWVFGGSKFYEDTETKTRYYVANSGEMICVSNFSTAAIDLNIVSSDTNESLLFWADPEKVPPRGTKVYLILTPGEFLKAEPQKLEPLPEGEGPQNDSSEKAGDQRKSDDDDTDSSKLN